MSITIGVQAQSGTCFGPSGLETDPSKWDHVNVGTMFYVWLLSGAYYDDGSPNKHYREFMH